MKTTALYLSLLSALLLLAACDSTDPGEVETEYFVESYQVAGEPIGPVRLSRTADINARYDFDELAVSGASVNVLLVGAGGAVESTFPLTEQAGRKGVYIPSGDHRVLSGRTYRLEIAVPATGDRVSASTTVPEAFRLVEANADTIVYQGAEQLKVRVTRSGYPGRPAIYVFQTEALDPRPEALTPYAANLFDNDAFTLDEVRIVSSTPLNEANYTAHADGTLSMEMPWIMIYFYGPQRTAINAIDDNLYDFISSYFVQQGGSTLSPGEIPNILDHVEGGTGVFGSYATLKYTFYVRRN